MFHLDVPSSFSARGIDRTQLLVHPYPLFFPLIYQLVIFSVSPFLFVPTYGKVVGLVQQPRIGLSLLVYSTPTYHENERIKIIEHSS